MTLANRALFLDRDGVINVDFGYVCSPDRTQFVPGIFELCAKASRLGYLLIIVTNQAGIGRGYYTEDDFLRYMEWMRGEFSARGIPISAVYFCPHHPEAALDIYRQECTCRKPAPGMFLQAAHDLDIDMSRSMLVGDKPSDAMAAHAAGVSSIFVLPGDQAVDAMGLGERIVTSLDEVTEALSRP